MKIKAPAFDKISLIPTRYIAFLILLLFIPAHLIYLGKAAFIGDEAIRALVALEMHLSGNYFAPTMHGAPYLNKPPLFNWVLLVFFKIFGCFGEYPARAANVFFLAVYGWIIYRFVRLEFGRAFGFAVALMVLTSGRLLIYDSMLGLIDTTFSVVIYALFMSIYYFGLRKNRWGLFLISYFLMSIGFLLKGLPAIVFQGLSLCAGLLWMGQWRKLVSIEHLAGILLGSAILGGYLWVYSENQPLSVFLPNLMEESLKRTAVKFGWIETAKHLIQFPVDSIYHFLPFSLLIVAWLNRHFWVRIRQNRFVFFNFLMLAVNLPVYWSSVQVYPRYLIMFIPLFTTLSFYLMELDREEGSWRYRLFQLALSILAALLPVLFFALLFVPEVNFLPGNPALSAGFGFVLLVLAGCFFADRRRFLWWSIVSLLVARIAFDAIILPARHYNNRDSMARTEVQELTHKYVSRDWYVFGASYVREPAAFYMTKELGYIVRRTGDSNKYNALYLVNPDEAPFYGIYFNGIPADTLHTDYPQVNLLVFLKD